MRVNVQAAGLGLMVATTAPQLWSVFTPDLHELATLSGADLTALRRAELQGSLFALGMGAGASLIAGSPWPFLVSALMVGYLLWLYETGLSGHQTRGATQS